MRQVRFKLIGSDPELVFVKNKPGGWSLVNAPLLVGEDKNLRNRSLIGCDGHASTAELRPPPCHNVRWHLQKIAWCMQEIDRVLKETGRTNIYPVAQPVFA